MYHKNFINFLLILLNFDVQSQNKTVYQDSLIRPLNNINIEVGNAAGLTLNYERLFQINKKVFFVTRVGIGYNEEIQFNVCIFGPCVIDRPEIYLTTQGHFTANFGKKKRFFEIGLGSTIVAEKLKSVLWVYPIIGYRIQPLKTKKLNFRIYACFPLSDYNKGDILFMPFGVSVGYVF